MMNSKANNILKSQRVTRRKTVLPVHGNTALKGIEQIHQQPIPKKHIPALKTLPEKPRPASVQNADVIIIDKPFNWKPHLLLISFCVLIIGFFSYYALLWKDDGISLNPESEANTRRKMLAYALGESALLPQPDRIPLPVSETFAWNNYVVKKGDSVSKIAADHGLSLDAVIASNNLRNARLLREGDVLRIPNMDGIPYTVQKGDTYQRIADRMNVALEAVLDANDIQDDNIKAGDILFIPGAKMRSDDLKMALGELFVYPVRGRLSSGYGWRKDPFTGQRRYHSAIDLASNTGAKVIAAANGRVTTVGFNSTYGNYIIITHSGGYQSMYAHLNSTAVKESDRVEQSDKIGEVGSTGHTTGPHLHFAIYRNGRAVNPLEHLKY